MAASALPGGPGSRERNPEKAGFRHAASIPCGMLQSSVSTSCDWLYCIRMKTAVHPDIIPLEQHHAFAELEEYDFPIESMTQAKAILSAKAWIDDNLACFFADPESTTRFVLVFESYRGFMPALGGDDMRDAEIGALYRLDVFVSDRHLPVVDRADRIHMSK